MKEYIDNYMDTIATAAIIIRQYKPHTTGAFLGECGEGLAGCVTHQHTMFPWYLHALPHCLPCQLLCQCEANLERQVGKSTIKLFHGKKEWST